MPELRRFRWSDLDGLVAVRNANALAADTEVRSTPEGMAAQWLSGGVQPERDLWVVAEGEEVVAYGGLRPWHSVGWLQAEIVVHPARRGRGLGSALLRRLLQTARRRRIDWLGAVATDRQPDAAAFLLGQGFQPFVVRQHMRLRPIAVPPVAAVEGFRVRESGPAESAILAQVTNAAYAENERVGRANAAGYRRFLHDSGVQVWVAERAGQPEVVGLCEVMGREVAIDGTTVQSGHIGSLAVHPDWRGRGLGRWLLATGIQACLEAGWPSVELNVDADNAPARHLYESLGFRATYGYTVYCLPLREATPAT